MGDQVWQVPQEQFIEAWNGAGSLPEAVARVKELAGGTVPRWAVMARAAALRKGRVEMRSLLIERKPKEGCCTQATVG